MLCMYLDPLYLTYVAVSSVRHIFPSSSIALYPRLSYPSRSLYSIHLLFASLYTVVRRPPRQCLYPRRVQYTTIDTELISHPSGRCTMLCFMLSALLSLRCSLNQCFILVRHMVFSGVLLVGCLRLWGCVYLYLRVFVGVYFARIEFKSSLCIVPVLRIQKSALAGFEDEDLIRTPKAVGVLATNQLTYK